MLSRLNNGLILNSKICYNNLSIISKRNRLWLKSRVDCYDNSGAKQLEVIAPVKQHPWNTVELGRAFIGIAKHVTAGKKVQRKQIIKGLLVTTKYKKRRPDGSCIQFNQHRAILLRKATKEQLSGTKSQRRWALKTEPLGNKIKTAIPMELRQKRFKKIVLFSGNVY